MTLCLVGRRDAVDVARHDLGLAVVAQNTDDGVQRTDPSQAPCAPAHGLWPGEVLDGRFQRFRDDLGSRAARLFDRSEPDLPFFVVSRFKLVFRQSRRAQKSLERLFGRIGAGAFAFFADSRTFSEQIIDGQNKAARCRKGTSGGVGQTRIDKGVRHQPLQIVSGARLHLGGDFLGKELDQEIRH